MKPDRVILVLSAVLILVAGLLAACCTESPQGPGEVQPTPQPTMAPQEEPTAASTEEAATMEPPTPTESPTDEPTEAPQPTEPPASADGETLLQDRCTVCHGLERITGASKTREEWGATVDRMVDKGAELNAEEWDVLVDYIAEMYGVE